jgi:lysophospholipase L1-like esterase
MGHHSRQRNRSRVRARTIWASVILASAAALVGLGLFELMLRLSGLASPPAVISVTEAQAARIPGAFVPRATVTDRSRARFPHSISVNSLGYRGREIDPEPAAGESRVLFAGDSFTWGDLVDDHETLPARLEKRLANHCAGGRVVNAGVGGTTIDGQHEMIRRGLALQPDLVVLMFYDNDIAELASPTFWEIMIENRRRKSRFPVSIGYAALNRTATWAVMRRAATRFALASGTGVVKAQADDRDDAYWQAAMPGLRLRYAEHLSAIHEELRNLEIPLLLVRYPSHLSMIDPTVLFNHGDWLRTLSADLGIPFVDLAPVLASSGLALEELYFIPWDGHARPVGYDLASVIVSTALDRLNDTANWCAHSAARAVTDLDEHGHGSSDDSREAGTAAAAEHGR